MCCGRTQASAQWTDGSAVEKRERLAWCGGSNKRSIVLSAHGKGVEDLRDDLDTVRVDELLEPDHRLVAHTLRAHSVSHTDAMRGTRKTWATARRIRVSGVTPSDGDRIRTFRMPLRVLMLASAWSFAKRAAADRY